MKRIILSSVLILLLSHFSFPQIGGYALDFDGTNDYVDVPDDVYFNDNTYTIEAWVYLRSYNNWCRLIDFSQGPGDDNVIAALSSGTTGKPHLDVYVGNSAGDGGCPSTTQFPLNRWAHIAFVQDGSNGYIYINGVQTGTSTSMQTPASVSRTINYVGKSAWSGDPTANMKVDELRIWSVARTANQIKADMYREVTSLGDLILYYTMSNGSGTSLTDNSGNSNTGTLTNGPTWKASGCFAGPRNALDFDGTNDFVDCGTAANTKITDNLTISAWVKTSCTDGGWRTFLTNHWLGFTSGMILAVSPTTGLFHYAFCQSTGVWTSRDPANSVTNDGKWHNIVITFQAGTIKTYFDGKLIDTYISGLSSIVYTNERTLQIGRDSGTEQEWWQGQIDEVSIWSRVLSENEVRENMTKTLTGTESNLAAYYRFDHVDGKTLYDLSSNAYNGTLYTDMTDGDWVSSSTFNTWIGSESNSWSADLNWSSGTAPAATDNVGLYKWDLGNEASVSGTPTVNNLLFSSTASPSLTTGFTVNGNLVLEKNIDLNGQTITLGNSGYLSEGSSRLYGTSGTVTTTRTLGTLTTPTNIGGLGFSIKSTGALGSTTITRGHTEQINGSLLYNTTRYYDASVSGGYNLDVVYNYNQNELNGSGTEANLRLFKSTDGGNTWTKQETASLNQTDNTLSLTGVSGLSRWTAADNTSPLPVELTSFAASISNGVVTLKWSTATEVNNYGFEVERTEWMNGCMNEWKQIGFVAGSGNSNSVKEYSFTDIPNHLSIQPYNHSFQYRLKQIDNDGTFAYSKEIEVENLRPSTFDLRQNYPNPFNPTTVINYQLPENAFVTLKIFDVTGNEVTTLINESKEAGYYSVTFTPANIASGVYVYQLKAGNFLSTKKLLLMK